MCCVNWMSYISAPTQVVILGSVIWTNSPEACLHSPPENAWASWVPSEAHMLCGISWFVTIFILLPSNTLCSLVLPPSLVPYTTLFFLFFFLLKLSNKQVWLQKAKADDVLIQPQACIYPCEKRSSTKPAQILRPKEAGGDHSLPAGIACSLCCLCLPQRCQVRRGPKQPEEEDRGIWSPEFLPSICLSTHLCSFLIGL